MSEPSETTLEMVKANGGSLTEEEMYDEAVDGGFWNLYSQTYVDRDGTEYTFDCSGDEMSGERVDHQCVEIKPAMTTCSTPICQGCIHFQSSGYAYWCSKVDHHCSALGFPMQSGCFENEREQEQI